MADQGLVRTSLHVQIVLGGVGDPRQTIRRGGGGRGRAVSTHTNPAHDRKPAPNTFDSAVARSSGSLSRVHTSPIA